MRVIILGSGVIGVTSAWYLADAGHEVVVVDRQPGPALETSFANAGEISPGYASPWAAPNVPLKALRWMFMQHAPLIIRPRPDLGMLRWTLAMLMNCTPAAYRINKERMVRLAEYSRDELRALRAATGIRYDERTQGTLQLFRKQKDMDKLGADMEVLRADGVPFELLDRAGCIAAEPGLAASEAPFVGGLRLPDDETGDCFLFTSRLAEMAAARGVRFEYGRTVTGLSHAGGRIERVETAEGPIAGDAFLVAMGSFAPALVAPLGIRLPVYPVKGYSITLPIVDEARAPVSTLLDESYKVAITRLGGRIRVGGMAELSGYRRDLNPVRRETLEQSVRSLFPGAGDYAEPNFWCGLRPMTPDSTPVIGPTRYPNLFLNNGHGTLGWTMACGSGHVIADIIGGRAPAIAADDLSINRYR
ncbi:D-amino acid dehydrogenase [Sandaracinobacter sp. RS1-74]|uniref:D-amino acid dehydrogenase n=1 Tax=Sandaracinobacteroides sayramensis TaxID=2913411 RepID=UPI001EDBEC11|nr:D-amino acid dehydrogenase [Sandaracinobacteroides sayramensis]MCG2841378.1 D-amino acid dehydrogenase [Sandaracinobacteroides sayramensis]